MRLRSRLVVLSVTCFLFGCGVATPKCDARSCSGCCDDKGACATGNTTAGCGSLGVSCQVCRSAEACIVGQCTLTGAGGGSASGGGGGATGGGGGGGGSATGGGGGGGGAATGGGSGGGGGTTGALCAVDGDCSMGLACHPVLKTCRPTCTGSTDCPSAEKTCAPISPSTARFCSCSSSVLCAAAVPSTICNSATHQCSPKCPGASCPAGFACDALSGDCTSP